MSKRGALPFLCFYFYFLFFIFSTPLCLCQIIFYLSGVMLVVANAAVFFLRLSKPPEGVEEEEEEGEEAEAKLEETARKQTQRITRCQPHACARTRMTLM